MSADTAVLRVAANGHDGDVPGVPMSAVLSRPVQA